MIVRYDDVKLWVTRFWECCIGRVEWVWVGIYRVGGWGGNIYIRDTMYNYTIRIQGVIWKHSLGVL